MPVTEAIPLTITPEAAAYVVELGLQEPFEQMLGQVRQVPGLRSLRVWLQPPYDLGGGPSVIMEGVRDDPRLADDPVDRDFADWQSKQFPPDVFQHFTLLTYYGSEHVG